MTTPICSRCKDTHRVYYDKREIMCTRCPLPCEQCKLGVYCDVTPCLCTCHAGTAWHQKLVSEEFPNLRPSSECSAHKCTVNSAELFAPMQYLAINGIVFDPDGFCRLSSTDKFRLLTTMFGPSSVVVEGDGQLTVRTGLQYNADRSGVIPLTEEEPPSFELEEEPTSSLDSLPLSSEAPDTLRSSQIPDFSR